MKVLIIGGGGREHAIAYALSKSKRVSEIHAIPGNPGIAQIGTCHPGSVTDIEGIKQFVKDNHIDFTVVGPEDPLCLGMADELEAIGCPVFGPQKKAAQLEGSKAFSKEFMMKHHIPTAAYKEVNCYDEAVLALDNFSYPVVIKADGLAAGKGVVICENHEEAIQALKDIMETKTLGEAGSKVVIEEFLKGFECSLLCFTDGETIVPMVSAKDHKQVFDGNKGPNTGGMGTFSPNPFLPKEIEDTFQEKILEPFMNGLKADQMDYRGVVFIGLMIDGQDVKVLEFNVRFGDPETQSILLRLETDIMDIFEAVSKSELKNVNIQWKNESAGCLVLASGGYPGSYEKGKLIQHLDEVAEDIIIFHAGTAFDDQHQVVTNGGRVLNICALGSSLEEIREKVYAAAKVIDFDGKYYRNDIGLI